MNLKEQYKNKLKQRMLEEGPLFDKIKAKAAAFGSSVKSGIQSRASALGSSIKSGIQSRVSSAATRTGAALGRFGNRVLDRAGSALRSSGVLDRTNPQPNSVLGIVANQVGRSLAARYVNRTRAGLTDSSSPLQRVRGQASQQAQAVRGRVTALSPERRAALKARLGGGQTTTERPRVTAAPDRMARQGGENRNAASAVAVRRGIEDRSIIQGLRRLARSGDRDAARKLATRQAASKSFTVLGSLKATKQRLRKKLAGMGARQAEADRAAAERPIQLGRERRARRAAALAKRTEPPTKRELARASPRENEASWVGRARFNSLQTQRGEVIGGPNTAQVTTARQDRSATRQDRQQLRGGDPAAAREAAARLLARKKRSKLTEHYRQILLEVTAPGMKKMTGWTRSKNYDRLMEV